MGVITLIRSMSIFVNGIGPAFERIGIIAKKMWKGLTTFVNDKFIQPIKDKLQDMKVWWAGFQESVMEKWNAIKEYIDTKFIKPVQVKLQVIKDWFGGLKDSAIEKIKGIWSYFKGKTAELWDSLPDMPDFFSLDFWKGLVSDIGTAFGGIGDFMIGGLKGGINVLIGLINDLLGSVNFNKTIENPFTGTEYSFGMDLSSWNIPMLAKGGIVNSPTLAMIGEAGPEAVVPLSGNNAGMGGTYNITVNAGGITDRTDKRALAREIGNMIQQELARSIGGSTMRGRY